MLVKKFFDLNNVLNVKEIFVCCYNFYTINNLRVNLVETMK